MKTPILLVAWLMLLGDFHSQAATIQVPYSGQLAENGELVTGTKQMKFVINNSSDDGTVLYDSGVLTVLMSNGVFHIVLGGTNLPVLDSAVFNGEARWLEISVGSTNSTNLTILSPRQPVRHTPYSAHSFSADNAATLGGVGLTNLAHQSALNAEIARALAAETLLQTNVNAEAAARTSAVLATDIALTNLVNAASNNVFTGSRSVNLNLENWSFNVNAQGNGYASNLSYVAFGDSTSDDIPLAIAEPLYAHFGSNGYSPFYWLCLSFSSANITNLTSASSTNWPGAHWLVGSNAVDGHQEIITTNCGGLGGGSFMGGGVYTDQIKWYLRGSPDAGNVTLFYKSNGAARVVVETTNCATTYQPMIITATVPLGWYQHGVTHSNLGPTAVMGLPQRDTTGRGVQIGLLNTGGSRVGQLINIAPAFIGPILADMDPKVILLKYVNGNETEMSHGLPLVRNLFTNYVPNADVVLHGGHPLINDTTGFIAEMNAYERSFCLANGWAFINPQDIPSMSDTNKMLRRFGAWDGTHPNQDMIDEMAGQNLNLLPWFRNAGSIGMFVKGTAPAGRRWFSPTAATNNLTGNLGVAGAGYYGNGLTVNGEITAYGASATLTLRDRSNPNNTSTQWQLFNSGTVLNFYQNAFIFEMSVGAGSPYLAPTATYSPLASLGRPDQSWNNIYGNNSSLTNMTNWAATRTVAGAGDGNTNYTLNVLPTVNGNQFNLGSSNVNFVAVMGGMPGYRFPWTAIITNLSTNTWGVSFSAVTNRWRFNGPNNVTDSPTVLTKDTALRLDGLIDGTNILCDWKYYAPGL